MKINLPLFFLMIGSFAHAQVPSTWSSTTAYSSGALVLNSSGVSYIAQKDVTAGTALTETSFWLSLDAAAPTSAPSTSAPTSTPDASQVSSLTTPETNSTTSSVTASGLTSASNEAFVMQQYLDFLGRDGDASGIAYWKGELDNGTQTRADCVNNFVFSAEFQDQVAPVSRLYQAYFLRIPDTAGLTYWINQKLAGVTLAEISNTFSTVTEFTTMYNINTDTEFVKLVYQNVLGRQPDDSGLSYWVNDRMGQGESRGTVMIGFSESDEYKATTLNNIRVIAFYYGMLRRAPDNDGFAYWVGKLNAGETALELINGFIGSSEYQARF